MIIEISKKDFDEVKVGARKLDDDILNKLLPTWNSIEEQINGFRKRAYKKYEDNINKINTINFDYDRYYDNIISILGARGTGKTSVLLTMKYKREYENDDKKRDKDIILPLIVPDDMSKVSDTLGWIIESFDSEVTRLSEFIFNLENGSSNDYNYGRGSVLNKCIHDKEVKGNLHQRYRELKKAYSIRKNEYFKIITEQYVGKSEYIKDNEDIINADRNIILKFRKFVDELVVSKRKENNTKYIQNQESNEPLIFMFFDDVDISNDKCYEVLDTIVKFLTHENVVVFVSGDYKVFFETTTIELLKKEGLLDIQLLDRNFTYSEDEYVLDEGMLTIQNTLTRKKEYAQEFLKKVMPPTFRYEMPTLNNEQKAGFYYKDKNYKLSNLINQVFNLEKIFPNYYFLIFDNTPRGLINVYYSLWEYKNLKLVEVDSIYKINVINQFVDVIVKSSKVLVRYENVIRNFILFKDDHISIDYYNLEFACDNLLLPEKKSKDNLKRVNEFIVLYLLGKFTEKISKGIKLKIDVVNEYNSNLAVFMNKLNVNLIPKLDEKYEELIVKFYFKVVENITMKEIGLLFTNSETKNDESIVNEWKNYASITK